MQFNPQDFAQFMEMWQAYKVFQQMTQPNPDPVQTQAQMPNAQQIAVQSNAAVSASVQEINDLKSEITNLKAQLQAAQSELTSTKAALSESQTKVSELKAKTSALSDVKEKISKLEELTGKSIEDITSRISKNEKVIPRKGKGAHDVFAEMIDEGKLDRDDIIYADSEDVLDAIEDSQDSTLSPKELLAKKQKEAEQNKMKEFSSTPTNQFGF